MTVNPEIEPFITAFAEIVRHYCSWVESSFTDFLQEMLTVRKLLAELHLGVLDLPDLGCGETVKDLPAFNQKNGTISVFKICPAMGIGMFLLH
jgi:hypothetical protein